MELIRFPFSICPFSKQVGPKLAQEMMLHKLENKITDEIYDSCHRFIVIYASFSAQLRVAIYEWIHDVTWKSFFKFL